MTVYTYDVDCKQRITIIVIISVCVLNVYRYLNQYKFVIFSLNSISTTNVLF